MNRAEMLRPKRKELVLAAKTVMEDAVRRGKLGLKKAQLSHLIGVCNEAACAEEIELYIRYQASREKGDGDGPRKDRGGFWDRTLAEEVIAKAKAVMASLASDELKVDAWRLFAVFLTREFTYQQAAHPQEPDDRGRGPAPADRRGDPRRKGGQQ